jgi:2-oxo-3-hexenedioate decarboxylase
MSLSSAKIAELAQHLDAAARERRTVPKLTDAEAEFSMHDAYNVQWALRARRLAAGARLSGLKMGLTSRAKMKQMGVESPIYGRFRAGLRFAHPSAGRTRDRAGDLA